METNYYIGISDKLFEILKWITPVILFFLTYFISELIHFRKKRKRLKDLKNLLITHLDALQKEINDQIEANLNCISSTRDFNNPDVRLSRHYANNLERIKQIPFDEAYQILIKDPSRKYKEKEYYFDRYTRLYRIIDYYQKVAKTSYINNETTIKNMINEGENWNRSHSQLIYFNNMNVSLLNNSGIPLSNDPFIYGLAQHINNYNQSHPKNNQNLEAGFNDFVLPLIHFAKDLSSDPRSVFLMQLLQESKKAFLETKNLRQNAVKELEDVTNELQKDIVKLIEIIDEIKNKA